MIKCAPPAPGGVNARKVHRPLPGGGLSTGTRAQPFLTRRAQRSAELRVLPGTRCRPNGAQSPPVGRGQPPSNVH
eukprot:7598559-Alexandrium_andersonii.AAC.1